MRVLRRRTWVNYLGNQTVQPLFSAEPRSLEDLVAIVRAAEAAGLSVKAAGGGLSFSDLVQTTGYLVHTDALDRVLPVDPTVLRSTSDASTLFSVEAGMRLSELNQRLEAVGLSLDNLPACSWQTIAGAIATATHGSGLAFGPISDLVASLVVVGAGGVVYRIEPSSGITDPAAFRATISGVTLVQDDDWFYAAVVGLGCMGLVHSVTLRVRPALWLEETRRILSWSELRRELAHGDVLRQHRHYEILVNPHAKGGEHSCLVTMRDEVPAPLRRPPALWSGRRANAPFAGHPVTGWLMATAGNRFPRTLRAAIDNGLRFLAGPPVTGPSAEILDLGGPNGQRVISTEVAVPLEATVDAVDELLAQLRRHQAAAPSHTPLPLGVRFVRSSPAFLAMSHGRDTCAIESPVLPTVHGAHEQLVRVERTLVAFEGRTHWGQVHHMGPATTPLDTQYPMLDRWRRIASVLNRGGVFDNTFSDRWGLSYREEPRRAGPRGASADSSVAFFSVPEPAESPQDAGSRSASPPLLRRLDEAAPVPEGGLEGTWDRLHHAVASDGRKIAVYEYRPALQRHRTPILLTHSLSCDHHIWDLAPAGRSLADRLRKQGFWVFSVDHRGRGRSDRPETGCARWSVDDYISFDIPAALAVIEERTGERRVHLGGHSLGAIVCYAYAIRHGQDRLRTLVTFGGALSYQVVETQLRLLARAFPLLRPFPYLPVGVVYRKLAPCATWPLPWNDFLYHRANVDDDAAQTFLRVGMHNIAHDEARQLLGILDERGFASVDGSTDYAREAHRVTVPVLAIGGDRDLQCPEDAIHWTVARLGSTDKTTRIFGRESGDRSHYGHQDLLWGKHAPVEVWPYLLRWLEAHDELVSDLPPPDDLVEAEPASAITRAIAMTDRAVDRLHARAPQPVRPSGSIAVKRDVHVFEVDATADDFARSFATMMANPESTFGVVRIKRPRDRVGAPFEVGERFQGGFSVELATRGWLGGTPLSSATDAISRLLRARPIAKALGRIEDAIMSNYGEIQRIAAAADGSGHTLRYGYLEGTPIAGSSTFTVEPLGDGRCRVTQVFEYQEVGALALETFQRFGLKLHDRAVFWQVQKAAEALGVAVRRSTIPLPYP